MLARKIFKRQDSSVFDPAAAVAELPSNPSDAPAYELDTFGEDHKDDLVGRSHEDDEHPSDPSALSAAELDPSAVDADGHERPMETDDDFISRLVASKDDPDMPIHTFRMYFLGLGLTCFAAVLGQIFYFRPSSLTVSSLFILVVAHVLGKLWHVLLPKADKGPFWAFLNPCDFNIKEHVAILIMSTTAFSSAFAIGVFAADELYYDLDVNYGLAIFTMIASQFLGYGIAGLMRSIVVFPSYALWPNVLPTVQLFQLLHKDKDFLGQRKRMKVFGFVFLGVFVWEWFPEFIAPTLTGVSVFCLAKRNGTWWSRVFGGAYANEGLGLFSLCFDWSYISGWGSLYTPLSTQLTIYGGLVLCMIVMCASYAGNAWKAQNFPFMAQDLFYENGSVYDQSTILNADFSLNRTLLAEQGLPWYATTNAIYYLGQNMALGATFTHCVLWYGKDVLEAFRGYRSRTLKDKHYQTILKNYKEVPMWVYGAILLGSFVMAIATCYTGDSHLPWYGIIAAYAVACAIFPFICIFPSITGWQVTTDTLVLMLGSAVVPGNSQANMYFQLFGANAATQGINLASDLKLAQYTKLPPRTTLWVQSLGTVIGGILQIVIAKQILSTHREILLDVAGNNIWSGQNVQSFNSQSVTWGALGKDMYASGKTYAFIPLSIVVGLAVPVPFWLLHRYFPRLRLNLLITPLICYTLGYLASGINSTSFMAVLTGVGSQWFWRKYRPTSFRKYNYIVSAALDAGMQVFVFVTTFALFGAGNGTSVYFPNWALNPAIDNIDYCMYTGS